MIRPSHNLIEDENYYANTRSAVAAVQDIGIQHLISTYNSTTQSSGIKSRRKDEGHSLLLIEEANLIFKEARLNMLGKSESWFFGNDSDTLNNDQIQFLLP